MLIDIPFYDKFQNPKVKVVTWHGGLTLITEADPISGRERIELDVAIPAGETGVYWSQALENFLEEYSDYRIIHDYDRKFTTLREHLDYLNEWGESYGVADNLEQIMMKLSRYWFEPDRNFILALQKVRKVDQPPKDGWRWSKWGPYIGEQESRADYLADEPFIDELILYEFYEVVLENNNRHSTRRNPSPDEIIVEAVELIKSGYLSLKELTQIEYAINAAAQDAVKRTAQNIINRYGDLIERIWYGDVRGISTVYVNLAPGLGSIASSYWHCDEYEHEDYVGLLIRDLEAPGATLRKEHIEGRVRIRSKEYYDNIWSLSPEIKTRLIAALNEILEFDEMVGVLQHDIYFDTSLRPM
jgi:hypothetical protein